MGLSESTALVVLGLANVVAAIYFFRRLPANMLAFARAALRLVYRLEVAGRETCRVRARSVDRGQSRFVPRRSRAVGLMEEPPVLAVDRAAARRLLVAPLLNFAGVRPMDPAKPLDRAALIAAARAGRALAVFPEGRMTLSPVVMRDLRGAVSDRREDRRAGDARCASRGRSARSSRGSIPPIPAGGVSQDHGHRFAAAANRDPPAPDGRARRRAAGAALSRHHVRLCVRDHRLSAARCSRPSRPARASARRLAHRSSRTRSPGR